MHYILASASPRRKELLRSLGIDFEIKLPDEETNILNKSFSYELVERTAVEKGLSVAESLTVPAIVISADTVVIFNNIILGKPKSFDDAFRTLKMLSGNTHQVVTSLCIIDTEKKNRIVKSEKSEVTFNKIDDERIKDYIYKFRPYDKAGSYGIQELEENFINEIKGDYDNIVGLPLELLKSMLIQNSTARNIV